MNKAKTAPFETAEFLATAGAGRRVLRLKAKEHLFSQGSSADSVFYIQSGRAKLTVISGRGKEATITLLAAGDFVPLGVRWLVGVQRWDVALQSVRRHRAIFGGHRPLPVA